MLVLTAVNRCFSQLKEIILAPSRQDRQGLRVLALGILLTSSLGQASEEGALGFDLGLYWQAGFRTEVPLSQLSQALVDATAGNGQQIFRVSFDRAAKTVSFVTRTRPEGWDTFLSYGLLRPELQALILAKKTEGFIPVDVASYEDSSGKRRYLTVFLKAPGTNLAFSLRCALNQSALNLEQGTRAAEGYRLISLDAAPGPEYCGIWVKDGVSVQSELVGPVSAGKVGGEVQNRKNAGWSIHGFVPIPGTSAQWVLHFVKRTDTSGAEGERRLHRFAFAVDRKKFDDYFHELSDAGYRIASVRSSRNPVSLQPVYSFIAVPNLTHRLDFSDRSALDQVIQSAVDSEAAKDLAGGTVGVLLKGQIVYLRGIQGKKKPEKEPVFHGKTRYRLASLSKGITGLLVHRLAKTRGLNLTSRLADATVYPGTPLAGHPNFSQECTMQDAIDMACGVPNYGTSCEAKSDPKECFGVKIGLWSGFTEDNKTRFDPSNEAHRPAGMLRSMLTQLQINLANDPALAKIPLLFDKTQTVTVAGGPSPSPLPRSRYEYSTFSYLPVEDALLRKYPGETLCSLLKQQVSDPLKIGLSCEDESGKPLETRSRHLSRSYSENGTRIAPEKEESLFWRLGGGGFTGSAQDVLLLARGLLRDRSFLTQTEFDTLWIGRSSQATQANRDPRSLSRVKCGAKPKIPGTAASPCSSESNPGEAYTVSGWNATGRQYPGTANNSPRYYYFSKDGDAQGAATKLLVFPDHDAAIVLLFPQKELKAPNNESPRSLFEDSIMNVVITPARLQVGVGRASVSGSSLADP